MSLTGELFVGHTRRLGGGASHFALSAETGEMLEPRFTSASNADVEEVCELAWEAFSQLRQTSSEERAKLLDTIAQNILSLDAALVERATLETGLPRARIEGERTRTVNQLRMFAQVIRYGACFDIRIDEAQPNRAPIPSPELRMRNIPLGPVVVFSASNFPLAFSVAGGDTASAFAAGCPVIVKAHSAHPGTSELVAGAVQDAVRDAGLPSGTFSMVFTRDHSVSHQLVADSRVRAVGFTGSRSGGKALAKTANAREVPIPVYAEMSSINPVVLLPGALSKHSEKIANEFVSALTLGAGQFCTNPGLIIAIDGPDLEAFLTAATSAFEEVDAQTMLTPSIHQSYCEGVEHFKSYNDVVKVAEGQSNKRFGGQPFLFKTTGRAFLANSKLQEEVFGSSSLVVACKSPKEIISVLESLEGQLTTAVHYENSDADLARELIPLLEIKAGRILFNGFGTGVEVAHAMVHGGPFPATSDGRTTSVGSKAIERFMRPVCYQNVPTELLPKQLFDYELTPAMVNGKLTLPA
ncbi:MAG: aldehyde dehydrogenase (NADP(+)) [Thalassospira sp.]|uniref:aldehyde dehydrogenase (NADP(+)) n=1 Tax=Thalassospira sp. TaxID=1912094 RepID=UPI0032EBD92C